MMRSESAACAPDTFGNNAKYSMLKYQVQHQIAASLQLEDRIASGEGVWLYLRAKDGSVLSQQALPVVSAISNITWTGGRLIIEYTDAQGVVHIQNLNIAEFLSTGGLTTLSVGSDNQILSPQASAFGGYNIAGLRGFLIQNIQPLNGTWQEDTEANPVLITLEEQSQYTAQTLAQAILNKPISMRGGYNGSDVGLVELVSQEGPYLVLTVSDWPTYTSGGRNFGRGLTASGDVVAGACVWFFDAPQVGCRSFQAYQHAQGAATKAESYAAHSEGYDTIAGGRYSHTQGQHTRAGYSAHAQGDSTKALGQKSHTQGTNTQALQTDAHAQGRLTTASGQYSHAEGYKTETTTTAAHAEGGETQAKAYYAHSQGFGTEASGVAAHAEGARYNGQNTIASGSNSHAQGQGSQAKGEASHAEGRHTITQGAISHAQGQGSQANGAVSHAQGQGTIASAEAQHVQGKYNIAKSDAAHIVGWGESDAIRKNIHQLLTDGTAIFAGEVYAQSENMQKIQTKKLLTSAQVKALFYTKSQIDATKPGLIKKDTSNQAFNGISPVSIEANRGAHVEGYESKVCNDPNSAFNGTAQSQGAHAEGLRTRAAHHGAHSEGESTIACGRAAHAEGRGTIADGGSDPGGAHAEGYYTIARTTAQHVQGKYNADAYNSAHIVGNGTADARKNIHVLDWNGNAYFAGTVYVQATRGGSNKACLSTAIPVATKADLKLPVLWSDIQLTGAPTIIQNNHAAGACLCVERGLYQVKQGTQTKQYTFPSKISFQSASGSTTVLVSKVTDTYTFFSVPQTGGFFLFEPKLEDYGEVQGAVRPAVLHNLYIYAN